MKSIYSINGGDIMIWPILARQLRQEQQEQTNSKAPKKILKQKSWISPGEKILGITFGAFSLFWFRPYHFQSGIHLPN